MDRETLMAAICSRPVPFTLGGMQVFLRTLKIGELSEMIAWESSGAGKWYQILFVRTVCDASGERLFSDEDAANVANFDAASVNDLVKRAEELNRFGEHAGKVPSPTIPT